MADRLQPANRRQQSRPEDRAVQLGTIGDIKLAFAIFVDDLPVLRHVDWCIGQFNMLNAFKVASGNQPKPHDIVVVDLVFDDFINAIGRKRLTELLLMTRLSALSRLSSF